MNQPDRAEINRIRLAQADSSDRYRVAQSKNTLDPRKHFEKSSEGLRYTGAVRGMDPLSFRFRHVVAILFAAVVTAAALRHVVHVYGGIPREEIRTDALLTIPLVVLAIILLRRKRRQ